MTDPTAPAENSAPANTGTVSVPVASNIPAPAINEAQGVDILTKMRAAKAGAANPPAPTVETPPRQEAAEAASTDADSSTDEPDADGLTEEAGEETPEIELPGDSDVVFEMDDGTPVTKAEARKGYLRHDEWNRKSEVTAEVQRAAESRIQIVDQAAEFYAARLPFLIDHLAKLIPPEPDAKLRETEPHKYWDQYNDRLVKEREIKGLENELVAVNEARQQAQHLKDHETFVTESQKLLDKLPAWKNPRVAAKERAAISKYATTLGYSDAEMARIDHRAVLVLRDAVLGAKVRANNKGNGAKGVTSPTASPRQTAGITAGTSTPTTSSEPKVDPNASGRARFQQGVALLAARRSATQQRQ